MDDIEKFAKMNVRLLEIKPMDVLVVDFSKCPQAATDDACDIFLKAFPIHKVIFISNDVEIGVIRKK